MSGELERVTPEAVGISSENVLRYITELEASGTEMHGIMIARHGKVCAEGWWAPFSSQLRHGCQSLTKSYITTGIGLLVTSGQLDIDTRVAEILPEYMPAVISENLKKLRVRDLLCMGSGMRELVDGTQKDWLKDFFSLEFLDEPGTTFWYSGIVTSVLGAIICKISGQGILAFLKPRLFDKIGIDADRLKWMEHPDGQEYGGGGLFATTEDNLRLGMLYLQGGLWHDERILSEEWVRQATTKQIDNADPKNKDAEVTDESAGYGFQIWMSKIPGNYMFWGAHGQYVMMMPKEDMVISITQFVDAPEHRPDEPVAITGEANVGYRVFNRSWEFAARVSEHEAVLDNQEAHSALTWKMASLALPKRPCGPVPKVAWQQNGKSYQMSNNKMSVLPSIYGDEPAYGIRLSHKLPKGLEKISFKVEEGMTSFNVCCAGKNYQYFVGMDGIDRVSHVSIAHDLPDMVTASGYWSDEETLVCYLRFIETCYVSKWTFHFSEKKSLTMTEYALFSKTGWLDEEIILIEIN